MITTQSWLAVRLQVHAAELAAAGAIPWYVERIEQWAAVIWKGA